MSNATEAPKTPPTQAVSVLLSPLLGLNVNAKAQLIGSNYTNVTCDLGACVAAGMTVHLAPRDHRRAGEHPELFHGLHGRHEQQGIEWAEVVAANASRRSD